MKVSRLIALLLFAASFAIAIERIGTPVSPSLWNSYLPNPAHPSYASNLGSLLEGRLTLGFQNASLSHLSLSVPGLQIISANTRWRTDPEQERWLYDPKHANTDIPERGYYRDLFLVSGGGTLSSLLPLKNWDIGIGGTFKSLEVQDEDEEEVWKAGWLGFSFSLSVNSLLASGAWDKYEHRYLLAYHAPGDLQAGMEFYQNWDDLSCFGVQPGVEKIFHESLKFHGGMRWQFADSKRVEFMLNFGLGIRFRPWRAGVDPEWISSIVSPFNSAIFYDWELSFDSNVDTEYKTYYWLLSVSKWF